MVPLVKSTSAASTGTKMFTAFLSDLTAQNTEKAESTTRMVLFAVRLSSMTQPLTPRPSP